MWFKNLITRRQLYYLLCCLWIESALWCTVTCRLRKVTCGCWSGLPGCYSHSGLWTGEWQPCVLCLTHGVYALQTGVRALLLVLWTGEQRRGVLCALIPSVCALETESEPSCWRLALNHGKWKSHIWKPWKAEIAHMWRHPLSKYLGTFWHKTLKLIE